MVAGGYDIEFKESTFMKAILKKEYKLIRQMIKLLQKESLKMVHTFLLQSPVVLR